MTPDNRTSEARAAKWFWGVVFGTLIIKLLLALAFPLTEDEAYFIMWGRYPAWGYSEHPPMIGWILHLLMFAGHSAFVMRLPAVLATVIVGIAMYAMLRQRDATKAALTGILFLVSPFNLLYVIVTTDAPLLVFSFLSALCLWKAIEGQSYGLFALSGLCLGAAFFSKYFATLLGFAYLLYFVASPKDRRLCVGFLLLFACVLPFGLINLYWNYTHCWIEVVSNLFYRNKAAGFSWSNVLLFVGTAAYMITPPLLYYFAKGGRGILARIDRSAVRLFGFAFLLPMLIFATLCLKKRIGLHWTVSFFPYLYVLAWGLLSEDALRKSIRGMLWFGGAHLALALAILCIPLQSLRALKDYPALVFGFRGARVADALRPYAEQGFHFASPSYGSAALLSFYLGRHVSTFGTGTAHGRQDDLLTDYSVLAGKNMIVFSRRAKEMKECATFFDSAQVKTFEVEGATFHLVEGKGFQYEKYRGVYLNRIRKFYYTRPAWLPMRGGYFYQRYFPNECR